MQAVIMVAGKSTRTYPLTLTRPKPILPVLNKSIISYNLDELSGIVDEVILIVGYRKDMLRQHIGENYRGMRIIYQEQKEQLGTGHAVLQAKAHIKDRFIVMNGDDLFSGSDIRNLIAHPYSSLAMEVEDPSQYGVIVTDEEDNLTNFVEKPKTFISRLTNVGCYAMEPDIFPVLEQLPLSERGEIELPSAILTVAQNKSVKVITLNGHWLPTGFPWDLLKTQKHLFEGKFQTAIHGKVDDGAVCRNETFIDEGSLVKSGAEITGPVHIGKNVVIGSGCIIGPYSSIGDNVSIGNDCRVEGSIIMNRTEIGSSAEISHSVAGENVQIGNSVLISSQNSAELNVTSKVKENWVDTGLSQLGAILADGVKVGAGSRIMPGCKIWPELVIPNDTTVEEDVTL